MTGVNGVKSWMPMVLAYFDSRACLRHRTIRQLVRVWSGILMSDDTEALQAEYLQLMHAVQTGVEYLKQYNPTLFDPKHARVGINSMMVSNGALVGLLIGKGVITQAEYYRALNTALRDEITRYEDELFEHIGVKVTLA